VRNAVLCSSEHFQVHCKPSGELHLWIYGRIYLVFMALPIIHSTMTTWRCSNPSERIWSTSRLALWTPVPRNLCVCQVTNSRLFNGDPGFWRDNVLECQLSLFCNHHHLPLGGIFNSPSPLLDQPRELPGTTRHCHGHWHVVSGEELQALGPD